MCNDLESGEKQASKTSTDAVLSFDITNLLEEEYPGDSNYQLTVKCWQRRVNIIPFH
jgi:hypothetical protein